LFLKHLTFPKLRDEVSTFDVPDKSLISAPSKFPPQSPLGEYSIRYLVKEANPLFLYRPYLSNSAQAYLPRHCATDNVLTHKLGLSRF
jgi:hypothetical protein